MDNLQDESDETDNRDEIGTEREQVALRELAQRPEVPGTTDACVLASH